MADPKIITKEPLTLNHLPTEAELEKELGLAPVSKKEEVDPILDTQTDKLLDSLLGNKLDTSTKKRYVNEMGMKYQTQLASTSKILDQSIRTLSNAQDGGPVATSLLDLRSQVEELNPSKYDLTSPSGAVAKFFRNIFGVKNPISKYFEKYEASGHVIDEIMNSLRAGKEHLIDDNQTLDFDKQIMRDTLEGLTKAVKIGNLLYKKLEIKLKTDIDAETDEYRFIQEELLFPLNQRIIDLQTTLAVNQQGVISYDLLIRNNTELINGVNRTITITTSALRIAVTTRLALNKQRQVLEATNKINKTTADLIEDNARVIQTQGVEIQKMAAESTINVDQLANAFDSLNQAMDEISSYRRESLPAMRDTIDKFKNLSEKAEDTIDRMERGTKAQDNVIIDITDYETIN